MSPYILYLDGTMPPYILYLDGTMSSYILYLDGTMPPYILWTLSEATRAEESNEYKMSPLQN